MFFVGEFDKYVLNSHLVNSNGNDGDEPNVFGFQQWVRYSWNYGVKMIHNIIGMSKVIAICHGLNPKDTLLLFQYAPKPFLYQWYLSWCTHQSHRLSIAF